MAKKTAARSGSNKKKRKVSGKRGSAARRRGGTDARGVVGVAVLCVGLLALACQFIPSGGGFLNACMRLVRGLGGTLCLLLPIVVCALGVALIFFSDRRVSVRPMLCGAIVFVLVETLLQLFQVGSVTDAMLADGRALDYGGFLARSYSSASLSCKGGGLIGALLAWPLYTALDVWGAAVVLVCALAIALMVMTGVSFGHIGMAVSEWADDLRVNAREKREEREALRSAQEEEALARETELAEQRHKRREERERQRAQREEPARQEKTAGEEEPPQQEPAVQEPQPKARRKGKPKLEVVRAQEESAQPFFEEQPQPMRAQQARAPRAPRRSGGQATLYIERSDEFDRQGIDECSDPAASRRRAQFTIAEAEKAFLYGMNAEPVYSGYGDAGGAPAQDDGVQGYAAQPEAEYDAQSYAAQPAPEYDAQSYAAQPAPEYDAQNYAAQPAPGYDAQGYAAQPDTEYDAQSYAASPEPDEDGGYAAQPDENGAQDAPPVAAQWFSANPTAGAPAREDAPAYAAREGEEEGSVPSSIPASWPQRPQAAKPATFAEQVAAAQAAHEALTAPKGQNVLAAQERQSEQPTVMLRGGRMDGTPLVMPKKDAHEAPKAPQEAYAYPPLDLLNRSGSTQDPNQRAKDEAGARKLLETLESFGVQARLTHVTHGPAITRYELQPAPGVKVSRIVGLVDDIALNMASDGVRIEAPIPGKPAVGIEIPNEKIETVSLRDVLESPEMAREKSPTAVALGKGISGAPVVADMAKMPHVLIAGATGSGKSVCINTIINSIIYRASPREVRLILIDPKVVELSVYNGIPHLLIPVVTDPKKASAALSWAVVEMEHRYKRFESMGVRDIRGYNNAIGPDEEPMSKIIVIIDELADLMMVAPGEVEESICRLAQLARAAGIHLVIATQRPSVNVITGVIKANIPSRIAFAVSSQIDSRTILDSGGAEKLLGKGDMLYAPQGAGKPTRVQGCFVSDDEVQRIVDYVRGQHSADYSEEIIEQVNSAAQEEKAAAGDAPAGGEAVDEMLSKAIEMAVEAGQVSISMLQRRLRVGYARAGRLVDEMTQRGITAEAEGPTKPRTVLITREEWRRMQENQE